MTGAASIGWFLSVSQRNYRVCLTWVSHHNKLVKQLYPCKYRQPSGDTTR